MTPVQGPTLANSKSSSTPNNPLVVTLAATTGVRGLHARSVLLGRHGDAASAGRRDLIWATNGAEVPSTAPTRFVKTWNPGLTGTTGNAMTITLGACGATNTGTLQVQADQF
jgi:hypothetical protein